MRAIVAPAFAALIAESAISFGVTGTCSLLPVVSPAPVTAQDKTTFLFIIFSSSVIFWNVLKYFSSFEYIDYAINTIVIIHPFPNHDYTIHYGYLFLLI